ncbi:DUF4148 domain-containing protein [Burkholderia sp. Ac-20379]|uniref:DUF4148 domain-containing protein n=1 Tax=Burkholderia sp. Ac-20379 TaxID=2703900 RepID=UPI00197DE402|nr:DUF4148 domain-containing protein [Burkholderia sp. Ac-20379]MBN3728276.1 DUF4148 domain-containing protein [Burkholderia sp. Ac-20379]
MQVSKLAVSFALAASLAAASSAFAAAPAQSAPAQASAEEQVSRAINAPLTRADVRRQLVEAQQNGQIAALRSLYRGS